MQSNKQSRYPRRGLTLSAPKHASDSAACTGSGSSGAESGTRNGSSSLSDSPIVNRNGSGDSSASQCGTISGSPGAESGPCNGSGSPSKQSQTGGGESPFDAAKPDNKRQSDEVSEGRARLRSFL